MNQCWRPWASAQVLLINGHYKYTSAVSSEFGYNLNCSAVWWSQKWSFPLMHGHTSSCTRAHTQLHATLTYHTTPTCNTQQIHTHIHTHTHTHTHTGAPIDNENEKIMEEKKKLNASERQVAKLYLDYQDTETSRVQFKDDWGTYIHRNSSLYNQ